MKKKKNRKKLTAFIFIIFVISLYFFIGVNITVETEGSESINNPQKILIAIYFGEESNVLCASPLNNTCFYPNVYYGENEVEGQLYTYFENEYREVIKYKESYFIKENKYLENMKNKVGELKNGKVRFNKTVYKKEGSETKRESVIKTAEQIIAESCKISSENKISLFLSKGSFTEFISVGNINKRDFTDMLEGSMDADLYKEESFISDIANLSENNKEEITLIILNAGKNTNAFIRGNTQGFKYYFVINFLSPYEIEGEKAEIDNIKEEKFESYNIFCEESENTVTQILEKINKKCPQNESILNEHNLISTE